MADNAIRLLYSPLADGLIMVSEEDAEMIERCLETDGTCFSEEIADAADELRYNFNHEIAFAVPDVQKITKMSVIPNNRCNFSCSYCYSAEGRNGHEISWTALKTALDWFINPVRFDGNVEVSLSLFISGGGEPLLSWGNITRRMLEYARRRADEFGFSLRLMVISNGSLVTPDITRRLAELDVSVGVSFEVLPELQESQRGHYDEVVRGLEVLRENGVATLMNSTITPQSVHRMKEMYCEVRDRWPFVKRYTMEPVTGIGLFKSAKELHRFYDAFFEGYLRCKTMENEKQNENGNGGKGPELRFTFDDEYRDICVRHCPGKFSITPEGTISVCHLVSSPKEERYSDCVYGTINESGITTDHERFTDLYRRNVSAYPECDNCFAKWICGGECLTRRATYPADYLAEVCRFNRRFVKHQLIGRVRNEVKEAYGMSLEEFVK